MTITIMVCCVVTDQSTLLWSQLCLAHPILPGVWYLYHAMDSSFALSFALAGACLRANSHCMCHNTCYDCYVALFYGEDDEEDFSIL